MSCHVNSKSNPKSNRRQGPRSGRDAGSAPEVRFVQVSRDRDGQRIDNFLSARLKGVPRPAIYRLIRTGQVRINGGRCKPHTKLAVGDSVRIPPVRESGSGPVPVSPEVQSQVEAAVLFENADYLVVDKPSGMAVHGGSGLPWGLIDAVRQSRPGAFVELAHRLDRETSGCLALALNGQALRHLSEAFRDGRVVKKYLCLLDGRLPEDRLDVDAPIGDAPGEGDFGMRVDAGGKAAQTRFTALERFGDATYAEAELFTGRTHQVRVHAAHLGMPLAGDKRYAETASVTRWSDRGLRRLFLHAHHLQFVDASGEEVLVNAPLPEALKAVLERLGT